MAELYNNILKVGIGRVKATAKVNNYFPVVGSTIQIDASTKWGQSSEWQTQDGSGNTVTSAGNLMLNKDSKQLTIAAAGVLSQRFKAINNLSSAEITKAVYAMQAQALPYFSVEMLETFRVGETGSILVKPENGYNRTHTVTVKIYKENKTADPVRILTFGRTTSSGDVDSFLFADASDRGVYDIEVDVRDAETGITLSQRHNKRITVIPELCPRPADTTQGYEVAFSYHAYTSYVESPGTQAFECRLWRNVNGSGLNYAEMIMPQGNPANGQWDGPDVSGLPAGTTLVLRRDPQEPEDYPMRLFLKGNKSQNESSASGTPNFTRDAPLVITHDETDVMQWGWRAYGAFSPGNNMRNVVIDGYGYHNTGIHFYPFDNSMFVDSCLYINNGCSDFELFGLDVDGAGFAGLSAKTDPNVNMPWFWRESGWEMHLNVHHCTFRNTVGEGVYIGYFDTGERKGTNSAGQAVTYHAHVLRDLRVYRCNFIQNGYDSVQINNACGVEFCYNLLDGCGYRREPGQGSAFSCTMDGRIYNCTVKNNYNIIGVFGPFLSGLEIFNCILTAARMESGWVLTAWSGNMGVTEVKDKFYSIHNNIIKAARIATLNGDVTFENYTMDDNIFITENEETKTPGYFTGNGNIFLKADRDYENIDAALKVADSANYDYQIAHNAPAATAGRAGKSSFDMRGYKNWYVGNFHAGPFMGKYKDPEVADSGLALSGILIEDGAMQTYVREVNVLLNYAGTPTKYRIGETKDLSSVAWINLAGVTDRTVKYTLSEGFANKTLYAQVANANETSSVVSSAIEYKKEPVIATMSINGGAGITTSGTVSVKFNITGVYSSLQYMLSEDATFAGCSYADYAPDTEIQFTFSGKGNKTLYGSIKSDDGQEARTSATIEYSNVKAICSFGWFSSADYGFDPETGIFRMRTANSYVTQLNNILNEKFCQCQLQRAANGVTANGTGNNSGRYPDKYLGRGIAVAIDNRELETYIRFTELKNGNYKVRLMCNGDTSTLAATINSSIGINGRSVQAVDFLETFKDNFNTLIETDVEVTDGTIEIIPRVTVNFKVIPINIIEIEGL